MMQTARAVICLQDHQHGAVCEVHGHDEACGDENCRMCYPRSKSKYTMVYSELGVVLIERGGPTIVPYQPGLMLAQPCNQAFYYAYDMGRYTYQHAQWEKAKEAGSRAEEPVMKSAEEAAADNAEYTVKYNTKPNNEEATCSMAHLSELMRSVREAAIAPAPQLQPP
jgi:hypothetical protein